MDVVIVPTPAEVGERAAEVTARLLRAAGSEAVLGVATGSSPLGLYAGLAERVRAGELDLSRASAFALDEYVGLPDGHPESYREVVRRTVTEPLGMDPARVHVPDGQAADLDAACVRYERAIAESGGVDVQIVGVGVNGHIGFNEPATSLASRTRVELLTDDTRRANSRFFASIDEVPRRAVTQGLGTILDARHVVLVATGSAKADAVTAVVEGPVGARRPGSVLQLHPEVTVVVDEEAAAGLELADYYCQMTDAREALLGD
ncbi:glucosamine-6-phosphate deaminase [Georgenia sp. Z1491]|uniref:glucosamine-6-phosphate deaminase n=1 Tax=Georgenia sp. Z1491 TaxID=3416707 RepID=UPI003CF09761